MTLPYFELAVHQCWGDGKSLATQPDTDMLNLVQEHISILIKEVSSKPEETLSQGEKQESINALLEMSIEARRLSHEDCLLFQKHLHEYNQHPQVKSALLLAILGTTFMLRNIYSLAPEPPAEGASHNDPGQFLAMSKQDLHRTGMPIHQSFLCNNTPLGVPRTTILQDLAIEVPQGQPLDPQYTLLSVGLIVIQDGKVVLYDHPVKGLSYVSSVPVLNHRTNASDETNWLTPAITNLLWHDIGLGSEGVKRIEQFGILVHPDEVCVVFIAHVKPGLRMTALENRKDVAVALLYPSYSERLTYYSKHSLPALLEYLDRLARAEDDGVPIPEREGTPAEIEAEDRQSEVDEAREAAEDLLGQRPIRDEVHLHELRTLAVAFLKGTPASQSNTERRKTELLNLLKQHGVGRLSDLDPDKYPQFKVDLAELNNKHF